ncbi:FIST C-terminal domain-containing protein [Pseudodesulfovibrio sp. zrk46]|uniref:FIST C-terminal domain-containing protein n=1 Tax=Pseudodesulfovibrio sp. zrk46 TaxID=2725288 RepID=UPI001448D4E9|nr:FIST C-terminal domain-containing protein [Pseudodesulfovibrio sp. zrk46]QJB55157.1 hypothetical protein HFN16_01500 [Pseudodesulfovibrio sp. zrk46]
MEIIVDHSGCCTELGTSISKLVSQGCKSIMLMQAEDIIHNIPRYKGMLDKALSVASKNGVQIFGGIFPTVFAGETFLDKGSILAGIDSEVHVVTLENITANNILPQIEEGIAPIQNQLKQGDFNTLFVFGDGFGEINLELMDGLNHIVRKYPMNVIGGMTGRGRLKVSHYSIFSPEKLIQNGAVLAFTRLKSSVGVRHGWTPLKGAELEITKNNGCFVERIDNTRAFDRYVQIVSDYDEKSGTLLATEYANPDTFFNIAVKYPLGLIREENGKTTYIDRTPLGVGADRSLQFSVEIPEGTKACLMELEGKSDAEKCQSLAKASIAAYDEAKKTLPSEVKDSRVIMMDCFGRKMAVERMQSVYSQIELKAIAEDQKAIPNSPIGALCFGEISSMGDRHVELHNKTAVVGLVED